MQKGRMSDRWQVDEPSAAPPIGRRLLPVIAICGFLVVATGLILWATGGNSAAVVSQGVASAPAVRNDIAERTSDLEVTQQQAVDQLQVVQDQLAAQQAETRKLTSQLEALTEKLDVLQQTVSNIPAPSTEASAASPRANGKSHH